MRLGLAKRETWPVKKMPTLTTVLMGGLVTRPRQLFTGNEIDAPTPTHLARGVNGYTLHTQNQVEIFSVPEAL